MKKQIKYGIGILLMLIAPLVPYIIHFSKSTISGDPYDWAALGSYWGGILTPLLTAFTVIILITQHYRDREENRKMQKEKIVESYIRFLDKAEDKLNESEARTKNFLPPQNQRISAINNPRGHGSHPIIWELVDAWHLYDKILKKILLIDPENPVKDYFNSRYCDTILLLESLGYLKLK